MSTVSAPPAERPAVHTGPTWERGEDGDFVVPELTLGWEIHDWAREYLRQPDGPDAGESWRYTEEQLRWILWWFAVDEHGRWVNRSGMLRRVKGWGKDPLAATLCAVEFVGPCRFGGFDAEGEPVGVIHPAPWVQIAAVSKVQTRNTMTLFPALLSDELQSEHSIDIGKEIIYADRGRRRLEAVTSSPRALEGGRSTFTLKNETQHWLRNNEGHEMSKVIARNSTKSRDGAARVLAISNAHEPGEDSDAEHDYEAHQAIIQGKSRAKGFMYDSLEAPPDLDLADEEQLRDGLVKARGDSEWLDIDAHVETIYDPRTSPATSRRFYLNHIIAAEDAWISPHEWDQMAEWLEVKDGEEIALGFDGSKSDDHSALMGCRVSDGYVFTLGVWDPAEHGGEAPRDLIDEAVQRADGLYFVTGFFSDLHPWESYVDKWAEEMGNLQVKATAKHKVAWDMRARHKDTTIEIERLHDEIVEGVFKHDGNPSVRQHFANARRRPNQWGVSVGKEHRESARKIDSVPSTMLARTARRAVLGNPRRRRKRTGKAVFV